MKKRNNARKALINMLKPFGTVAADVDYLLAWLWTEGFKVVPLTKKDLV